MALLRRISLFATPLLLTFVVACGSGESAGTGATGAGAGGSGVGPSTGPGGSGTSSANGGGGTGQGGAGGSGTGAGGSWAACDPATSSFKSDLGVYPEPPLPALPAAGGTYVDPTFGTTILRLTDDNDGTACTNAYSYWPTFNVDSTRLLVSCSNGPLVYAFDPATLTIQSKDLLLSGPTPGGGYLGWEDAIWSATDPDILYGHEGPRLWSLDVVTKQYTLVRDFSADLAAGDYIAQMSKSIDDDVFAFTTKDATYNVSGYLAWRRSTDAFLLKQATTALDEVEIDKTGDYLVIKTGMQGAGVVEVKIADLANSSVEDLVDDGPDFAPGHSDNGHGVVIGADNWNNRVLSRALATPHQFQTALDLKNDWTQDFHLSMLGDNESWALVSLYTTQGDGLFHNEIIQVATDGSQAVRRLAHHRTFVYDYWDTPRANISRDGCLVAYTSNFGGSTRRDVFILSLAP